MICFRNHIENRTLISLGSQKLPMLYLPIFKWMLYKPLFTFSFKKSIRKIRGFTRMFKKTDVKRFPNQCISSEQLSK